VSKTGRQHQTKRHTEAWRPATGPIRDGGRTGWWRRPGRRCHGAIFTVQNEDPTCFATKSRLSPAILVVGFLSACDLLDKGAKDLYLW